MVRRFTAAAVALAAILLALVVSPTAAHATNGDTSYTVSVGSMTFKTSDGVVRSEMRNIKVVFWKNTLDGSYWQVVTGQLRDRSSDGYCAKARYSSGWGSLPIGTECNAVWVNFNKTMSDSACSCGHSLEIVLWRGSSNTFPSGPYAYKKASAPSGW